MITRAATFPDIYAVWGDLSDQSSADFEAAGYTPWTGLRLVRKFNLDNPGQVALLQNKPAAVLGVVKSKKIASTWFIATQAYFDQGAPAVLHARRFLRDRKAEYGKLTTTTRSQHPDVDRWFNVLGFKKVGETDSTKVFEYA